MIRDAAEPDLARILAITNQAIAKTTTTFNLTPITLEARRTWMAERQSAGFPVLVAELEGKVAGFGTFGAFRPWEGYLHTVEHSLYVDPDAQGRGCGRALLAALIERAKSGGHHVMVGGLDGDNAGSRRLHESAGFIEVGRMPEVGQKFGRWLDLVLMQKIL